MSQLLPQEGRLSLSLNRPGPANLIQTRTMVPGYPTSHCPLLHTGPFEFLAAGVPSLLLYTRIARNPRPTTLRRKHSAHQCLPAGLPGPLGRPLH